MTLETGKSYLTRAKGKATIKDKTGFGFYGMIMTKDPANPFVQGFWYHDGRAVDHKNDNDIIEPWVTEANRDPKYYYHEDVRCALQRAMINCEIKTSKQEFLMGEFIAIVKQSTAIRNHNETANEKANN